MSWRMDTSKRDELARRAKMRAKERGIALSLALMQISRECPALAEASRQEVLGRKLEFRTIGNGGRMVIVDVAERLASMAHARASEKNISYAAALSEIGRENRELVEMARASVLGRRV